MLIFRAGSGKAQAPDLPIDFHDDIGSVNLGGPGDQVGMSWFGRWPHDDAWAPLRL